jgi:hypothetical protein
MEVAEVARAIRGLKEETVWDCRAFKEIEEADRRGPHVRIWAK